FSVLMGIQAQFLSADLARRGPALASMAAGKPAATAAAPIPKVFRKCRLSIQCALLHAIIQTSFDAAHLLLALRWMRSGKTQPAATTGLATPAWGQPRTGAGKDEPANAPSAPNAPRGRYRWRLQSWHTFAGRAWKSTETQHALSMTSRSRRVAKSA